MSTSELLDLYKTDPLGQRAVVVKNLQNEVRKDNLQNFLEVICTGEFCDIFFPLATTNVAVAVFLKDISDIREWQDKAERRKFEGLNLSLQMLEEPGGIFINNLPDGISEELLSLYFESRKSGSLEDTVDSVKILSVRPVKQAVVEISSTRSIASILSKENHQLKGKVLRLVPYYASVHNDLVSTSESRQYHQDINLPATCEDTSMYERTVPRARASQKPLDIRSEGNSSANNRDALGNEKPRTLHENQNTLAQIDTAIDSTYREPKSRYLSTEDEQHVRTYPRHTPRTEPSHLYIREPRITTKTDFRLKIISDDPSDDEIENNLKEAVKTQSSFVDIDGKLFAAGANQSPNIAEVKPIVKNFERQISKESDDSKSKKRKPRGKGKNSEDGDQPVMNCEGELQLKPVEIVMLIIFRFQSKNHKEKFNVNFREKESKVIIKGCTDDDVKKAKLKMLECLNNVVHASEPLSKLRFRLLAREICQKCIRTRCINKKVRAAFEVDDAKKCIQAHAFSTEDADKGLEFVKEEITTKKIQLRPGQEQFLNDDSWTSMIESLDNGLTTVFREESTMDIIIESFIETKAKEALNKILQFLKQHVPKKSAEVVLETAKARCFLVNFEKTLRRDVERKRGKLSVETQSNSPLKIKVHLEGEESLVTELNDLVNKIWHERIDFSKISDRDEDKWLMFRGLDSKVGAEFFRTFERSNRCYIDVSKNGEFRLTQPRLKIDDGSSKRSESRAEKQDFEDIDIPSDSDLVPSDDSQQEDATVHNVSPFKRRSVPEFKMYQGEMSEDEALARACAMSLEDYNSDTDEVEITRPRYERMKSTRDGYKSEQREMHARMLNLHKAASSPILRYKPQRPSNPSRTSSIQMFQTSVKLIQGEIVRQKADALVNIVSPTQNLTESVVSKAFVKYAGQEIIQLYEAAKSGIHSRDVVRTDACGNLKCSSVIHVALVKGEQYCQPMLQKVMPAIFQECRNHGDTSVAIPPLGVGRMYKYQPDVVAERMLYETYSYLQQPVNQIFEEVTIVIFDDPTYDIFEKALQSFNTSAQRRYTPVQARPYFQQDPFQDRNQPLNAGLIRHQGSVQSPFAGLTAATIDPPTAYDSLPRPAPRPRELHSKGLYRLHHMLSQPSKPGELRPALRQRPSSSERARVSQSRDALRQYKAKGYYDQRRTKQRRPTHSRFPDRTPASNLSVIVIAADKDSCITARNDLGKRIKQEFLHEEKVDKRQKISKDAKSRIVEIIVKNGVESFKEKDRYVLKGYKENVRKAQTEIFQVLLDEKDNSVSRRRQKSTTTRETKEFVKIMVEDEPEVPPYWKHYKPDTTLKSLLTSIKQTFTQKPYEKVELDQTSQTFASIVKMINSTFEPSKVGKGQDAAGLDGMNYSQLFVLKIQRIENLELYAKFTSARQQLYIRLLKSEEVRFPKIQDLPNCSGIIETTKFVNSSLNKDLHSEVNEVFLFHGTKKDNIGTICSSGLDQKLGSGRAMFGPGIYGAEYSTKADQYADEKGKRSTGQGNKKRMFLLRMLLGNSYVCNDPNPHKYRRPPCTSCFMDDCKNTRHEGSKFGHMFNSVVGDNGKLFREFVVYDGSMCYPEYLITYERR